MQLVKKIAFITPDARPTNSHGRYVLALAAAFAPAHDVHIFTGRRESSGLDGVQYHLLPVMQRPSIARVASLWAQAAMRIRGGQFDIVHAQAADTPVGHVVTAHSCHPAAVAQWPDTTLYAKFHRLLGIWVERFVYRRIRLTIAVSHRTRHDLMRYYQVPGERIRVVHHGVDTQAFDVQNKPHVRREVRKHLGFAASDFALIFTAGNYRRKGLLTVLDALENLSSNVKLLVLGCHADSPLVQRLNQSHLRDRVVMTGPVDDVGPYYAASDCFVLPTVYDTFGLVVLEAMASELPVIVSAAAGASELINDGENGFILPDPDDVSGLTQRLQRLVGHREFAVAIGQSAYRKAQTQSWDAVAQQTMQIYQEVASRTVRASPS